MSEFNEEAARRGDPIEALTSKWIDAIFVGLTSNGRPVVEIESSFSEVFVMERKDIRMKAKKPLSMWVQCYWGPAPYGMRLRCCTQPEHTPEIAKQMAGYRQLIGGPQEIFLPEE